MVERIFFSSILSAMLLLSGCGDSEGESRLSIQLMLDEGDYSGVISALESSANSNDDYIALGAAYMGKAGVSLTNIVSAMASNDNNTSDDGFATFVNSIADISTPTALTDLGKSADNYKMVVGDCASPTLSDSAKDICLYIGLGATTRTAVTIDNLVGDISTFADDTISDDKLTASICAMGYALNGTDDGTCDFTPSADVNFTVINKVYTPLVVTVNADINSTEYHYLMTTDDSNQTVLTNGYCTETDFSTRVDDYNLTTAPYACPINEDPTADELTTASVLVDILNEGMDAIGAAVTDDIQEDVDEFKCEILNGTYDEFNGCLGADITQDISEENIIDYLNTQNGL